MRRLSIAGAPARLIPLALALALAPPALAQKNGPDRRGEEWTTAREYQGVTPAHPIPPEMRQANSRGIDGSGLCVIASIKTNGVYQGIGPEVEKLWQAAHRAPGGYSPGKLQRLIERTTPNLKYASHTGRDPAVLERLIKAGYPCGVTMNTGAQYGYRPIHHMVSLIHFERGKLAAIIDNNNTAYTMWIPAEEMERRWIDGGDGWVFAWEYAKRPFIGPELLTPDVAYGALAGAVFMAFVLLVRGRDRPPQAGTIAA